MSIQTRLAEQADVGRIAEITQDYDQKNLEGYKEIVYEAWINSIQHT